ncbi:WhiB family transcriptional regulator [Arthrobacter sp. Br18]|uniref:WhiB family transcriptional regulator n=1 Tax=Arthrobacter sp. Br18 TaxID=1312954 RepID=UPI0004B0A47D|nr:WhiB family transcriptional regulator [Arthrobacter sp. Br18]
MSRETTRDDTTETAEWRNFLAATSSAIMPCVNGPEWTSDDQQQQRRAAALCNGCNALRECRAYAFAVQERHGVLGGLTEADRKRHRRQQRGAA